MDKVYYDWCDITVPFEPTFEDRITILAYDIRLVKEGMSLAFSDIVSMIHTGDTGKIKNFLLKFVNPFKTINAMSIANEIRGLLSNYHTLKDNIREGVAAKLIQAVAKIKSVLKSGVQLDYPTEANAMRMALDQAYGIVV